MGEVQGFPVYNVGGKEVLPLSKRDNPTGLDLTCAPGSSPLVVVNQDVFTRPAAKGSLQFLTLTTTWGVLPKDDRMPNALGRVVRAAVQDMDLKALQAMLD